MKVLFISAWYPNRYDELYGVFVQRHAEAVSLHAQVEVLYVHPDSTIDSFETVVRQHKNIKETIIYFPAATNNFLSKIKKQINYLRAYILGWKLITSSGFRPQLIHANILTRTGFVAYCIKRLTKTPYIITEHWSRYLPEHNQYHGFSRKLITRIIVQNASAILPVSNLLKQAMIDHKLLNKNYIVINNVINPVFFETYSIQERLKKRIILITCFDEPIKNVKGILRVIHSLSKSRTDFELEVIGNGTDYTDIYTMANNLNLTDRFVFFKGEKSSREVAESIYNSDFMILFSNFETAGIVIIENLVLGKPIISTRVGIAPDFVDKKSGIIIEVGDENALYNEMNYLLDNLAAYDNKYIRDKFKNRFSYDTIGNQISSIYKSILSNSR